MHTVALIGCGRISYKHIEGFVKNHKKMILVAACDPITELAEQKAAEYRKEIPGAEIKTYTDYMQMLKEIKPDIVTIATESGYHPEITVNCLNAGAHVIVEKPMALSTKDADWMIKTAEENGRKLAVCFQNRFNAPVRKLRDAVEADRFGRILHGMVQIRWNRNEGYYSQAPWRGTWDMDGGTLMNQCTHGIDLLQWMMGEDAVRVHGVTRRFQRPIEAEDFGSAIIEFREGSVGIVEGTANIFPTNLNESLSIFGETGSVVIGGLAVNRIESWRFTDADKYGDTEEVVINPDDKDPPSVYGFGHGALFEDFLDAVENNREPLVSGERGKKALEIILAIYKSMKTGMPVDLPVNFSTQEMKGIF